MHAEKKMLVLPVLIIMALSITGVSVAHWTDNIRIEGTVSMASLTLAFDNINPAGFPENPAAVEFHDGEVGERCGKDVAKTTIVLENLITDHKTGKSGYTVARITIENAYPCYDVHWTNPIFHNIGSIGAKIVGFNVSGTGLNWTIIFEIPGEGTVVGMLENAVTGENVIRISIVDLPENVNFEPCERKKEGEIDIHIEQDAEECHTYEFLILILYEQCMDGKVEE